MAEVRLKACDTCRRTEREMNLRSYEIRYEDGARVDLLLCNEHGAVLEAFREHAPTKTKARLQVVSMEHIEKVKAAERAKRDSGVPAPKE